MDRDLITRIAHRVFPPGSEISWNPADVAPHYRFWVIPGSQGPRWIIPQNPRHGWAVLRQWRPYDLLSRQKWALLMAAYRTGQLGLVPGVVPVGVVQALDADLNVLGWTAGRASVPVIYIGTPGATQKAIAMLVNPASGESGGAAKAPLGPRAAVQILKEADILERLAVEKPGIAPRVLFVDRMRGYMVQETVSGTPTGTSLTDAHVQWLARLRVPEAETSFREMTDALSRRIACIEELDKDLKRHLNALLGRIKHRATLPLAWVHGDFAPWNLRWTTCGTLAAFDWEFAESQGISGLDVVHFLCRVLMSKAGIRLDARRLETRLLDALRSPNLQGIVDRAYAFDLWMYYVIWYQIILIENGIRGIGK